ncbi:MAG: hypothetical protein CM1200mP38_3850 [Dehalococcoidia bacterium]|nr:MAG: hypothetical protein CM1200mP38_3850 [Dehalococcoidia bacterium]
MFPNKRLRRLRGSSSLRDLVRETQLSPDDFIFPIFITHGKNIKRKFLQCLGFSNFQWIY